MEAKKLTDRQRQCLNFCREFLQSNGYPPSRVEIAAALSVASTNTADFHLKALARKGYLRLLPVKNRNIQLVEHTNH